MTTTERLIAAARTVLDAYGGDIPDWLRDELTELEDAADAAEQEQDANDDR